MTDLIEFLEEHNACEEYRSWVTSQPDQSLEAIWATCPRGDWLLWLHEEAGTPWYVLEPVVYKTVNRAFEYARIDFGEVTPENINEAIEVTWSVWAARVDDEAAAGPAYWLARVAAGLAEAAVAAAGLAEAARMAAPIATEHLLGTDDCRELLPLPKI